MIHAQHLTVPAQHLVPVGGQPGQRPPPVGRIALALQQALAFQVGHDLADHRLGPGQMRRGLTDGERPGQRQVLEHGNAMVTVPTIAPPTVATSTMASSMRERPSSSTFE
ncbi:MAG TPA: hypothetical protein VIY52_19295 [Streptosporangiaceae bacterium]